MRLNPVYLLNAMPFVFLDAAVDALLLLPLPNELRVSYGERVREGGHAPFLIVPSLSTP